MIVRILGAGPAGLYLAYLLRKSFPSWTIHVHEQNARDVTFGFGVVLSGRAKEFIAEGDSEVVERLGKLGETWTDQHIVHRGERVIIDGSAYSGVSRISLLAELQNLCEAAGVQVSYGERIDSAALRGDLAASCDMLVGADGANSVLRDAFADAFGTRVSDLQNYYAWYGVARSYPAHTLTFKQTEQGIFCGHHYRYAPDMSTFVAEVDDATWERSAMYAMDDEARRRLMQDVFSDTLGGLPLISNRSLWRRWRLIRNDRWSFRNMVLIGDALRSAHPSIGSGTRLAMEDSIALWRALKDEPNNMTAAFARYEGMRKPIRNRLNSAAERSIDWYEHVDKKMHLGPYDFAYDYLLRTGVMTRDRLERSSPQFIARYQKQAAQVTSAVSA